MKAIELTNNHTDIAINNAATLNFEEQPVQVLDLQTLKRTYKENDVQGKPLKEIYHYQLIEGVAAICENAGLNYEIEEIFAAQNKTRQFPGVVVLPQVAEIYGANSPESHILRRVFTTIKIEDAADEETNTTIALAYHQDGIQAAIGANVRICHNQCILSPDKIISNYGANKVTIQEVFQTVQRWVNNFFKDRETDMRIIRQMKQIPMTINDVYQLIGLLTSLRVMHDSPKREVSSKVKSYPLNQSQISMFTDRITTYIVQRGADNLTLWDVYNFATEIYKPNRTEIPNLLPQNLSLMQTLSEHFSIG